MNRIKAIIKNNIMTLQEYQVIQEYQVNTAEIDFEFDSSWNEYAKYVMFENINTNQKYKQVIIDNVCTIPYELENGYTNIQVYGEKIVENKLVKRQPTNVVTIRLVRSIKPQDTDNTEPTLSEWQIYFSKIDNYEKEVKNNLEKVESYSNTVAEYQKQVEEYQDNVQQYNQDVANTEAEISKIQAEQTTQNNAIDKNKADISVNSTAIEDNAKEIQSNADKIDKHNTRINGLEKDNTANKAKIQSLENTDNTVKMQIDTINNNIIGINEKIPNQANKENQLADKEFVNSSITTNTATFQGTFNSLAELGATNADINDYGNVITVENGQSYYNRYTFDGEKWIFNFKINNTTFTAEQWKAINSSATAELTEQITTNKNDISKQATRITTLENENSINKKNIEANKSKIDESTKNIEANSNGIKEINSRNLLEIEEEKEVEVVE